MAVPSSLPAFASTSGGTSATESTIAEFAAAYPGLRAAMERDPGPGAAAAGTLGIPREAAVVAEEVLHTALGGSFGSAYFDVAAGKLVAG